MNLPPLTTTKTVEKTVTTLNEPYSLIASAIMLTAIATTLYVGIVQGALPRP